MAIKAYSREFYENQVDGSIRSANEILTLLYEFYQPRSVIDIGCGRGAWLAAAESLGAKELKGIDGEWVQRHGVLSKNIDFIPANLEERLDIDKQYDLCISVEVAEHLSESKASQFVETICKASSVVLFSAAIKGQGGTNHINEQPQSYWIKLFNDNGYECFDVIRSVIWDNDYIDWWYRQNIFVFYDRKSELIDLSTLKKSERPIYDVVHPKDLEEKVLYFEEKIHRLNEKIRNPSLRFILGRVWRFFSRIALGRSLESV